MKLSADYGEFLDSLKKRVHRMRAFFKAYGPGIVAQPVRQLAGDEKVAQPARELPSANPSQAVTELDNMILPQAVAEIPWGHVDNNPEADDDAADSEETDT